ncbi:hypothetical protein CCYA_CCYA10G2852 [Cyanidiococcus yangmingshanensis]|nr:hypothetical protein CCYA_CCYA10G2852 [Cyanidiococcus yangmingshanensis]
MELLLMHVRSVIRSSVWNTTHFSRKLDLNGRCALRLCRPLPRTHTLGRSRSTSTASPAAGTDHAWPTIYALATASGTGAIAVFRLSGSRARSVLGALLGVPESRLPPPRQLVARTLYDPQRKYAFDRGMVVWFPAPHSYTGEDVVELHLHGAPAVIQATFAALRSFPDIQPATAGAFTKRALFHGKMDLSQVEALADLIQADSLNGLALAVANLNGALRSQQTQWQEQLQEALAIVEAVLEFGEEHLEHEMEQRLVEATTLLRTVQQEIHTQIRLASPDGQRPELALTPRVILYGRVNAGKSSLFNALGRREASIVHAAPGTTRDVVEQRAYIDGLAVTLLDTAGFREAPLNDGGVEAEGIRRAHAMITQTRLRILVHDLSDPENDASILFAELSHAPSAVVLHKADLLPDAMRRAEAKQTIQDRYPQASLFFVSSRTGEGIDLLVDWLGKRLRSHAESGLEADRHRRLVQTQRQQSLLCVVHDILEDALRSVRIPELVVEQIRLSLQYLARMTGNDDRRFDAEETLRHIFSRFCIGK